MYLKQAKLVNEVKRLKLVENVKCKKHQILKMHRRYLVKRVKEVQEGKNIKQLNEIMM